MAESDVAITQTLFSACVRSAISAGISQTDAIRIVNHLAPAAIVRWIPKVPAALEAITLAQLGPLYESLMQSLRRMEKKKRGSFYTPTLLAQEVASRALKNRRDCSVIDPACGAAAILVEALAFTSPDRIYGMDTDPFALWLARLTLALRSNTTSTEQLDGWCKRIVHADALDETTLTRFKPFGAVIGNPPWVAYAGRQSAKLPDETRVKYRKQFQSFAGFPTSHGMFIERAAQLLAPGGKLSLLVPLQVADLNGYRFTRGALLELATVDEPLDELGFAQFEGVTEPTLLLCATRRMHEKATGSTVAWQLKAKHDRPQLAPSLIARLQQYRPFDENTFREGGFQSAGTIAEKLLTDWPVRDGADRTFELVPLREGKDIDAYCCRAPTMALRLDLEELRKHRAHLKPPEFFQAIPVIIRQTARYPIAAVHKVPHAFRNSLLAGFHHDPPLLCALLNSTLLRAWHLHHQRDGQQQIFPQLKVSHLRTLPAPPPDTSPETLSTLSTLAQQAEVLQFERQAIVQAFGPAPKTAFAASTEGVMGSPAFAKSLKNISERKQYDKTLAAAQECFGRFSAIVQRIDSLVFALYHVTEEEALSAKAVLSGRT